MCCCNYCKRWSYQIIKLNVNKKSMTHYIWYVLCSEQPSACFMNIMKLNYVLEAKKFNILRSVRCANNFGHHCILCIYIYIYTVYILYIFFLQTTTGPTASTLHCLHTLVWRPHIFGHEVSLYVWTMTARNSKHDQRCFPRLFIDRDLSLCALNNGPLIPSD